MPDVNDWRAAAACRGLDPALFYADGSFEQGVPRGARVVCDSCPVAGDCLREALRGDEQFGVWAGTSPRQRQVMRRRQEMTRAGNYVRAGVA